MQNNSIINSTDHCRFNKWSRIAIWTATVAHASLICIFCYFDVMSRSRNTSEVLDTAILLLPILVYVILYAELLRLSFSQSRVCYNSLYSRFSVECNDVTRVQWIRDTGYKCNGGVTLWRGEQEYLIPFNGFADADVERFVVFVLDRFGDVRHDGWHEVQPILKRIWSDRGRRGFAEDISATCPIQNADSQIHRDAK